MEKGFYAFVGGELCDVGALPAIGVNEAVLTRTVSGEVSVDVPAGERQPLRRNDTLNANQPMPLELFADAARAIREVGQTCRILLVFTRLGHLLTIAQLREAVRPSADEFRPNWKP